jgi:hypothetical protein
MQAQDYKSAVGVRLGYPLAISYKTFISESSAIEAYVDYRGYSFYNYISVNGYLGLQYTFPVTADGVPGFAFGTDLGSFGGSGSGLGVRYVLNRGGK